MKHIFIIIVLVFFVIFAVQAHGMTYTFEWTGVVGAITDGAILPATLPGVNVGDTFLVTTTYDTSLFGAGVVVTPDGLDYAAPAGLQMTYQFSSGGNFTENIDDARARDGGSFDQWTWHGGGSSLINLTDPSDTSYDLPFPTSFDAMHTLFLSSFSKFGPSSSVILSIFSDTGDLSADRLIFNDGLNNQFSVSQVSVVPEPSTMLLLGGGLLILVLFMRKRK